jgi:hypothetical protein
MPNLEFELDQLAIADRHIRAAEASIARMRATLQQEREKGFDTTDAQRALQAVVVGLQAFEDHRRLIEQTIADIRAGTLPST